MDDIRAIDDYSDCFDYAEKLGIGMDGLDTVEEMKERLTMAFQKCQPNFINYKEKVCMMMFTDFFHTLLHFLYTVFGIGALPYSYLNLFFVYLVSLIPSIVYTLHLYY